MTSLKKTTTVDLSPRGGRLHYYTAGNIAWTVILLLEKAPSLLDKTDTVLKMQSVPKSCQIYAASLICKPLGSLGWLKQKAWDLKSLNVLPCQSGQLQNVKANSWGH